MPRRCDFRKLATELFASALCAKVAGPIIAERRELQARLTEAGFDTEGADGVIGQRTRDAISGYQAQAGLAVTGEPSLGLLAGLR